MNRRSSIKSSILYTFLTKLVLIFLKLGVSIITARFLGPAGRGIYFSVIQFAGIINTIGSISIGEGLIYYFGKNKDTQDKILNRTTSGGATINDVVWHYGQEDMPFGGVGDSGIGSYHGHEGFKRFSHQKSVLTQFSSDLLKNMMPPYKGKMFESAKKNALK